DMVRLVERLPEKAADPIGTPEALLVLPTIVAVFDNVTGEITLITPARKRSGQSAEAAYSAARERLERVWRALERPLAKKRGAAATPETVEPHSNTTPEAYRALVAKCQDYCSAGDIFQVVPSQRFSAPLKAPPFAL